MAIGLHTLVDIGVIVILLIGFILARKRQFFSELFSLIGIATAAILTLHYYIRLSDIISKKFFIPENVSPIWSYVFLIIFLGFILSIGLESLAAVFKLEMSPNVDQWGGLFLGLVKVYLVTGLIFLGMFVSQQKEIIRAADESLSQAVFRNTAVDFYQFIFDQVLVKLNPQAEKNLNLLRIVRPEFQ